MMTETKNQDKNVIRHTVTVPRSIEDAFALFTDGLTTWWPAEYTWAQGVLDVIVMEPGLNGRCFERGPHSFECDWGRVLVWEPPTRVRFTWQISPRREPVPDPTKASEVEVRFTAQGVERTQVTLEHHHFKRHGEGYIESQKMLNSEQGWPYILACFETAVYKKQKAPNNEGLAKDSI
jgi:uncharacterized protein YndB with AHSA1/START domain